MSVLASRKCVRHPAREAAARCQACGADYCRECVSEHGGVLLCAPCLAKQAVQVTPAGSAWTPRIYGALVSALWVLLLLVTFYGLGQFLKWIPPEVHEGTVWKLDPES